MIRGEGGRQKSSKTIFGDLGGDVDDPGAQDNFHFSL